MVFKPETLRERLKRLEEVIGRLERYRGQPLERFIADVERQWTVERGFILAAECMVDIGAHILGGRLRIQPADQEDAIQRLGVEGIISTELAGRLRGFGGFRNILVHEYLRIDPARVHEYLETHTDSLRGFVAEVAIWLERECRGG